MPVGQIPLSSIRTVTVGSGIAPDLLTSPMLDGERSRACAIARAYRRWGVPPRPENVYRRNKKPRRYVLLYGGTPEAARPLGSL